MASETSALTSGDPTKLVALGVDQRISKIFVLGDSGTPFAAVHTGDVTAPGNAAITSSGGAIYGAHSGTQAKGDPDYLVSGQDATAALITSGDEAHASLQPGRAVGSGEDLLVTTSGNDDTSAFIAHEPRDPDLLTSGSSGHASLSTGENEIDTGAQIDPGASAHDATPSGDQHTP